MKTVEKIGERPRRFFFHRQKMPKKQVYFAEK